MSTYVMSDLHGCKEEFDQMLELISFNDYDELYILGDVCDRGDSPIPLYLEIMKHPNIHLILGNHDVWFLHYMDDLINEHINPGHLNVLENHDLFNWLHRNGGLITLDQFMELDLPTCHEMKYYLERCPIYKELSIGETNFLFVHAGMGRNPIPNTHIAEVDPNILLWDHIGLDDNPYSNKTMIVGHIPTFIYGKEYDGQIIHRKDSKIFHIDCGCCSGRTLGCLRLNDLHAFYVPSTYPYIPYIG